MKTTIFVLCALATALLVAPGVSAGYAADDISQDDESTDHCEIYIETRFFVICLFPSVESSTPTDPLLA